MPVDNELLEILVCPETHQTLAPAPPELLVRLNEQIERGVLRNRGGDPVQEPLSEGLVREDGCVLYIVADSIPAMLIEESIELGTH